MQVDSINNLSFGNVYRAPYSEKGLKLLQNNLKDFTAPKEFIDARIEHKAELHFINIPLGIYVPDPQPIDTEVFAAFLERLKVLKNGNPEKPLKYMAGNHTETDGIINAITRILGFTCITKSEAEELGMKRLKDFKWEHVNQLAQKRQEVLKSKGINISEAFHKYIYVFTGDDLKDYMQPSINRLNNLVDEVLSGKKTPINEKFKKFTQKIADIFRKKDFEPDSEEPTWEKAIKEVLAEDKKRADEFKEFLAGRVIKDSETVEEMIESLK